MCILVTHPTQQHQQQQQHSNHPESVETNRIRKQCSQCFFAYLVRFTSVDNNRLRSFFRARLMAFCCISSQCSVNITFKTGYILLNVFISFNWTYGWNKMDACYCSSYIGVLSFKSTSLGWVFGQLCDLFHEVVIFT